METIMLERSVWPHVWDALIRKSITRTAHKNINAAVNLGVYADVDTFVLFPVWLCATQSCYNNVVSAMVVTLDNYIKNYEH